MVAIVAQTPFWAFFPFFGHPVVFKNNCFESFLPLPLNNISVEDFSSRWTQTDILSGRYGWNSGPNLVFGHFPFIGHTVVFKNNCFESYSFTSPLQYISLSAMVAIVTHTPFLVFSIFGTPVVFKNNCFESYSFTIH